MVTMTIVTFKDEGGPFRYKGPAAERALSARIYRELRIHSPAYARHVYRTAKEFERKVADSVLRTSNGGGLL